MNKPNLDPVYFEHGDGRRTVSRFEGLAASGAKASWSRCNQGSGHTTCGILRVGGEIKARRISLSEALRRLGGM